MAGDWIKFELATLDKPEVFQIAEVVDCDPDAVVGKLMRVWGWFDQQTEDGNAPTVTKKLLDRLAGVIGFADAMADAGWLIENGATISLPHFDRHNGKSAKTRLLGARRVAKHKAGKISGNDTGVTSALKKRDLELDLEKSKDQKPLPAVASRPAAKTKRKTAVPSPFPVSSDMAAWARDRAPGVNVTLETEKFVNHWNSKGETRADWLATWRNWILNAQQFAARRSGNAGANNAAEPNFDDLSWTADLGAL